MFTLSEESSLELLDIHPTTHLCHTHFYHKLIRSQTDMINLAPNLPVLSLSLSGIIIRSSELEFRDSVHL